MPPKSKSVTTRSKASKQQREAISAASGSSPPKGTRPKKHASFESPAATGTTPQVVTETKQAKSMCQPVILQETKTFLILQQARQSRWHQI